jgi:hypothetical protein
MSATCHEPSAQTTGSQISSTVLRSELLPKWLREILVSVAVATRTITVFALAIAFGVCVAIKLGEGNPWVGAGTATGFLLFVVLPLRLWWMVGRSQ